MGSPSTPLGKLCTGECDAGRILGRRRHLRLRAERVDRAVLAIEELERAQLAHRIAVRREVHLALRDAGEQTRQLLGCARPARVRVRIAALPARLTDLRRDE